MRYSPNIKFSVSDLFGLYAPIYLFRDITLKIRTTRTKEAKSEFAEKFSHIYNFLNRIQNLQNNRRKITRLSATKTDLRRDF